MARIDDLIDQIAEEGLRDDLRAELGKLRRRTPFGIVFERHIPEEVALPGIPVEVGDRVVGRSWDARKKPRVVQEVNRKTATLRSTGATAKTEKVRLDELLVLKRLGDRVFPGLTCVEQLERDPGCPWHVAIEGENFHVLQLLAAGMAERFDCVYIDPPYNSGKKDWRYNNRYVDKQDAYRHSKWLAMMHRRLVLTRTLLAPDGVLVIAIDENEHAHLVMLLEQLFRGHEVVSVAIEHNPRGIQGKNFSYTNDFAVFVFRNGAEPRIARVPRPPERRLWQRLRNWGTESERHTAKQCFYPIVVRDGQVVGFGDVLPEDEHPVDANEEVEGGVAVWPIDGKGVERKWRYARNTIEGQREYLRVREQGADGEPRLDIEMLKHDDAVRTLWVGQRDGDGGNRYDANTWGTQLVKKLIPGESFPFPKSLYSTRDALYAAVGNRPDALVLDYFGGSGTTVHATALLNAEDGGRRRCVLVTNNEVGAGEERALRRRKVYPGDSGWEEKGIFHAVTVPRIKAALAGRSADGEHIEGAYFDGRPLAEGLEDNAAFLTLDYLHRDEIELGDALDRLYPLLWLAAEGNATLSPLAGEEAATVDAEAGWAIVHRPRGVRKVLKAIETGSRLTDIWVVTDAHDAFAEIATSLPAEARVTQLYDQLVHDLVETAEAAR